jgi:predicted nucleotidyltransferase
VTRLALFGSTSRDTASSGGDVDVLVAFDCPATSKRYLGVQFCMPDSNEKKHGRAGNWLCRAEGQHQVEVP